MTYEPERLLTMYRQMLLIRQFEERVKYLFLEGIMPGTIHQCHGQEAIATGFARRSHDDLITTTHRRHGHALAKGMTVEEPLDEPLVAHRAAASGKGGSMHMGTWKRAWSLPLRSSVGGIPSQPVWRWPLK